MYRKDIFLVHFIIEQLFLFYKLIHHYRPRINIFKNIIFILGLHNSLPFSKFSTFILDSPFIKLTYIYYFSSTLKLTHHRRAIKQLAITIASKHLRYF